MSNYTTIPDENLFLARTPLQSVEVFLKGIAMLKLAALDLEDSQFRSTLLSVHNLDFLFDAG